MRSRQLETALRSLFGAVGAHLRAEVAAGAEVPFEVGSAANRAGGGTPLYCYRALTSEFIVERDEEIKRLAPYDEAMRLLEGFDGLDRYLASLGFDARRRDRGARARAAIQALTEEVFDEQTDFDVQPERVQFALERLHDSTRAGARETALLATLHGMAISSPEIRLTRDLELARAGALAGLPPALSDALAVEGADEHLLVVLKVDDDDARAARERGSAVLRELLRALRLFGDGRIALGGIGWMQVGGGPWNPFPLGCAPRPRGMLAVGEDQEDELRAFCNLVSRRAPQEGEVAWALERFELGCEREHDVHGLSDHLLALRALLEPEGPTSCMLPGRLAALCATPAERASLTARVVEAIALEQAVVAGTAGSDSAGRALAQEIATHLKALLRDVICGHLATDLAAVADELLARVEPEPDGAEEREPPNAQGDEAGLDAAQAGAVADAQDAGHERPRKASPRARRARAKPTPDGEQLAPV
jgi:hypothetical protein